MSRSAVGFSQRIRLEWLEETVTLVAAGNARATADQALEASSAGTLAVGSHTRRNSRAKTIIVLLKIWLGGPEDVVDLRQACLRAHANLAKHRAHRRASGHDPSGVRSGEPLPDRPADSCARVASPDICP